ncbi:MAG: hypothetical protein ACT4NY_22665 [Pseudonocardiales bacterium]
MAPLSRALERGTDLASRNEFDGGHVTCGAVVIDDTRRLLLIRHKALGRWLLRELEEETGISWHGTVTTVTRHYQEV